MRPETPRTLYSWRVSRRTWSRLRATAPGAPGRIQLARRRFGAGGQPRAARAPPPLPAPPTDCAGAAWPRCILATSRTTRDPRNDLRVDALGSRLPSERIVGGDPPPRLRDAAAAK